MNAAKPFTTTKGKFLAVEVPEGSDPVSISPGNLLYCIEKEGAAQWKSLSGDIEAMGLAKTFSDEQWMEIVEADDVLPHLFKDYCDPEFDVCNTAEASGWSLLESIGLNPSTTVIIKIK